MSGGWVIATEPPGSPNAGKFVSAECRDLDDGWCVGVDADGRADVRSSVDILTAGGGEITIESDDCTVNLPISVLAIGLAALDADPDCDFSLLDLLGALENARDDYKVVHAARVGS